MQEQVQSAVPVTPPAPSIQEQVLESFRSENWLLELASSVGVALEEIPSDKRMEIMACKTKNWVNMKFFDWFKNRAPITTGQFTDKDLALFKEIGSIKNTGAYRSYKSSMDERVAMARRKFREGYEYLATAADDRTQLHLLEGKISDLTPEVSQIVADGWFQYMKDTSGADGLVFSTPSVVCKWYNKKAGVHLDVDLGRFLVTYKPHKNRIEVGPFMNNISVEGYYHPHVSNGVCWGNAEDTFIKSMERMEPSKAFLALRVILTNYNDESPYVDLYRFAVVRYPELLVGLPLVWKRQDTGAWVRSDDLPIGYNADDYTEDDEGNERGLVAVYQREYADTGIPESHEGDAVFFVKYDGDKYQQVEVQDWE